MTMKCVICKHKSNYHNGFYKTGSQLNNGINHDKYQGFVQDCQDLALVIAFHDMPLLCDEHF